MTGPRRNLAVGVICRFVPSPYASRQGARSEKRMPPYYSQIGPERNLKGGAFCGKRNGVFVDVGAYDGISFSNTLMFERELGWTGLCIEPNPDVFPRLIENRSATCLEIAIVR